MAQREIDPWMERLAWLMDRAIPVGRRSFGLDPLIGLIPGLGDGLSGLVSMAIIVRAVQLGIPKATVVRMLVNVGVDSIFGAIPILGTIFDFAFKANSRNLQILRNTVHGTHSHAGDIFFLMLVAIATFAIALVPVLLVVLLIRMLWAS